MRTAPGVATGAVHLDTMCVQVSGTYKMISSRDTNLLTTTFVVTKTPTGYHLIPGPIAHQPDAQYPCGTTEQPTPPFPTVYIAPRKPVEPLSYLIEPTLAAAQARSHQEHENHVPDKCKETVSITQRKANACDLVTLYWWRVTPLTDGTAAVVIEAYPGSYSRRFFKERQLVLMTPKLAEFEIRSAIGGTPARRSTINSHGTLMH